MFGESASSSVLTTADVILEYLYGVYEKNIDIQCRFKWTAGASGEIHC